MPHGSNLKSRIGAVIGLVALAFAGMSADNNWPQFRGLQAGVAADDPALPDTWGPAQNIAWKIDVPGTAWSSPVVWGDHVFVTSAINMKAEEPLKPTAEYLSRSIGGPMTAKDISLSTDVHRWMVYDVDFKTGRIRWERQGGQGAPAEARDEKKRYVF